jgi:hypothetical protein
MPDKIYVVVDEDYSAEFASHSLKKIVDFVVARGCSHTDSMNVQPITERAVKEEIEKYGSCRCSENKFYEWTLKISEVEVS